MRNLAESLFATHFGLVKLTSWLPNLIVSCPSQVDHCANFHQKWFIPFQNIAFTSRVYFRPLKKGVMLPLAIVKRGRLELPLEHIKKG